MATWIVALVLVGYPMLGTLIAFTPLPSSIASFPVRGLVLVFAMLLIARSKHRVLGHPQYQVVLLFWVLYFCRLLWDLFVARIPVAGEFMFNFVVFSVAPSLALMYARNIDEQRLLKLLLSMGSVTCILAIVAAHTDLATARSFTEEAEGRLFLDTVNPITFGHVGVTTLLAAISLSRCSKTPLHWLLVAAASGLGVVAIQLAASRGPLVSLLICLTALVVFNRRYWRLLIPICAVLILVFAGVLEESDNLLAARIVETTRRDHSEVRILMQAGAIQQFLDNPLAGSAIVEREFEDYPHNPVIESAMAMGVVGLMLFISITFIMLRGIARALRTGSLLIPLLALQYFSAAQFSGSLAESSSFWVFLALVAVPNGRHRRERVATPERTIPTTVR